MQFVQPGDSTQNALWLGSTVCIQLINNGKLIQTMAAFITILTPLSYIPVLFGIFIGGWGCLTIILRRYGLDLETAVPWVSGGEGNVEGPILLAGVAAFGFIQGAITRNKQAQKPDEKRDHFGPLGKLERIAVLAMTLALVTVPYWLKLPMPEIGVVAIGFIIWMIWSRYQQ